jgi:hypothetical protein
MNARSRHQHNGNRTHRLHGGASCINPKAAKILERDIKERNEYIQEAQNAADLVNSSGLDVAKQIAKRALDDQQLRVEEVELALEKRRERVRQAKTFLGFVSGNPAKQVEIFTPHIAILSALATAVKRNDTTTVNELLQQHRKNTYLQDALVHVLVDANAIVHFKYLPTNEPMSIRACLPCTATDLLDAVKSKYPQCANATRVILKGKQMSEITEKDNNSGGLLIL